VVLNFLKPDLGLSPHPIHPRRRAVFEFRMVFVLPCSLGGAQSVALLAALDFIASHFGQKRTPAALADELVDVGNQVNRKDDVGSSAYSLRHTLSVT